MNRRKFIKAGLMLTGAAVVVPSVLFTAKATPQPEGLTMAKLMKAKKILDADKGKDCVLFINDREYESLLRYSKDIKPQWRTFEGFKYVRTKGLMKGVL